MNAKRVVIENLPEGNLLAELKEYEKMCMVTSNIEARGTTTSGCGGLLTLICC